eukprot:Selendium_serpulae@DN4081_c0_g1_i2.p1
MLRAAIIRCAGSPSVRCFKIARANSTPHRLISTFSHQQELMNSEKLFVVDEFDNVINVATKRDCHLRNNGDKDKGLDLPPLHRAFSVFHFSPPMGGTQPGSRNLLLTQRAANKLLFPLHWSNTCCSHPTTADVIRDAPTLDTNCPMSVVKRAAKRYDPRMTSILKLFWHKCVFLCPSKMLDEVGMAVDSSDLVFVGKYRYHAISPDEKNLGETWGENEVDYVLISSTGVRSMIFFRKPDTNLILFDRVITNVTLKKLPMRDGFQRVNLGLCLKTTRFRSHHGRNFCSTDIYSNGGRRSRKGAPLSLRDKRLSNCCENWIIFCCHNLYL